MGLYVLSLTAILCASGSANDVFSKLVADLYTERYAFFVDQGNNVLYCLFSAVPMIYTILVSNSGKLPDGIKQCPQHKFFLMGFLDACGTFLSSVGAPGTPGHLQVVLNQTLILFTMLVAWCWLGTRYCWQEVFFAMIIFGGALWSTSDAARDSGNSSPAGGETYILVSIWIYLASNVPMALSNVYKEIGFADSKLQLDVWTMTCVTTLYQTILTFGLLLFQTLPYLSGDPNRGLSLVESWKQFVEGCWCFLGDDTGHGIACGRAGVMLTLYVVINLGFNFAGLLLTKHGSSKGIGSVLCSLSYAVKLPLSNVLFSRQWVMGPSAETLSARSMSGLVVVTIGFLGYLCYSGGAESTTQEPKKAPSKMEEAPPYLPLPDGADQQEAIAEPWAFHERVVGCDASKALRALTAKEVGQEVARELMFCVPPGSKVP